MQSVTVSILLLLAVAVHATFPKFNVEIKENRKRTRIGAKVGTNDE